MGSQRKTSILWNHFTEEDGKKDSTFNCYDINALWNKGFQLFNVDRTVHDDGYLQCIKTALHEAQEVNKMSYYRSLALTVTMSLKNPIEIDESIDALILKDSYKYDDIIEFKKNNADKILNVPVFIWISEPKYEDLDRIILIIDGIVVCSNTEEEMATRQNDLCKSPMKICKSAHKPVFFYNATIIEEYEGNQRRDILPVAQKIVTNGLDGIVLEDPQAKNSEVIQSLFTAIRFLEIQSAPENQCSIFSFQLKIPVLPILSTALAACLAAAKSKASAIFVLTKTGRSARWISCVGPPCLVLAITIRPSTARKLHIYRKIIPLLFTESRETHWRKEWQNRVNFGTKFALKNGLVGYGAKLVVLAPSDDGIGYCNSFQMVNVPYKCHD